MTQVAFLWHMHQPYYEDLVTREHILPWVRLHALKDYYGMVALFREFPGVRVTFNLVPSLLMQLEAFAANRAQDRYLDMGLKPASELTGQDIVFLLQNFFHAQQKRMIYIYPRYAELLARSALSRWGCPPPHADREGTPVQRRRQVAAPRNRARGAEPGRPRVPPGRITGTGRAVHIALVPSDPAALVRHRC